MNFPLDFSYLNMEMKVTQILQQLEELKHMLVNSADKQLCNTSLPHLAMEESIANIQQVKEELNKLDITYYHEMESKAS